MLQAPPVHPILTQRACDFVELVALGLCTREVRIICADLNMHSPKYWAVRSAIVRDKSSVRQESAVSLCHMPLVHTGVNTFLHPVPDARGNSARARA